MRKKKILMMLALLLMTAVGARAQATYTVTVKDGTEDAAKWSADPNPAREGQGVTIKYNGKKKVKRVVAVMAALRPLAEVTPADQGKIAGADGIIYGTKAAAEAAGTQAVAMIAYVGSETDNAAYKHGLAIALSDEGKMNWSTAKSTCEGKTPTISGAAWMLPSQNQWKTMFKANGGNDASHTGLNAALATAGGSKLLEIIGGYWSSSEVDGDKAKDVSLQFNDYLDDYIAVWYPDKKDGAYRVRACLVF